MMAALSQYEPEPMDCEVLDNTFSSTRREPTRRHIEATSDTNPLIARQMLNPRLRRRFPTN